MSLTKNPDHAGNLDYLRDRCANIPWDEQSPQDRLLYSLSHAYTDLESTVHRLREELRSMRDVVDGLRCTTHADCAADREMGMACALDTARRAVTTRKTP